MGLHPTRAWVVVELGEAGRRRARRGGPQARPSDFTQKPHAHCTRPSGARPVSERAERRRLTGACRGPELRVSSPDAHCRNQGPTGEATPQLGSPERAAVWLCCSEWSATRSSPEAKGSGCLAVYRVKGAAERPTRRPRGRGTRR